MSLLQRRQCIFVILILAIIIDVMGLGLIVPILSGLFFGPHAVLVNSTDSDTLRHLYYSLSLAAWPVGIFFGASYLGKLSDRYGRKPLILVCLLGGAASYFIAVLALYWHSVSLFIVSRLISGYCSGSYDLAQAAIVDISTDENRVNNMGWITFAATTGFIFGPMISGLTAHLSLSMPLWIAGGLALLNALSVLISFREKFTKKIHVDVPLSIIFTACVFIFKDVRVRRLAWAFLVCQIAWAFYILTLPVMLHNLLGWQAGDQSGVFMASGIASVISLLVIQPKLIVWFDHKGLIMVSSVIGVIALIGLYLLPTSWNQYLVIVLLSVAMLLVYSVMLSFFSHAVTEDEQGAVLGGIASCFAIAQGIAALIEVVLLNISVRLPLIFAGIAFVGFMLIMWRFRDVRK